MERKFNQEKALREVAETRVKALKKKIRAYENTTNTNTNTTTTTNGSNGSITHNNSMNHSNDTSIDAGYGGTGLGWMVGGGGGITRDDESVGTNQTHSDHKHLPPTPSLPYSDQLQ